MEVAVGGKALRQEFGADDLAVLEDEASGGLVRKQRHGESGDDEGIDNAEQNGRDESEENGSADDGVTGGRGLLAAEVFRFFVDQS